jgi:signal transduction histidine kinase
MLSVSKLESGDSGLLDPTEFSVKDIFEDIIERLAPMTQQHGSKLVSVLSSNDLKLYGDRFYWEQILFNLTENALKQNMQQKIKVSLKAEEKEGFVEISVKDNGKGIPSNHLPYIFNRFYRVQKHHSQNQIKGTGLGLSIVKHAVEAHNGSISAESTPNESTIFKILVPQGPPPPKSIIKKE